MANLWSKSWIVYFLFIATFLDVALTSNLESQGYGVSFWKREGPPERSIFLYIQMAPRPEAGPTGAVKFPVHTYLFVGATKQEVGLRIHVMFEDTPTKTPTYAYLSVEEWQKSIPEPNEVIAKRRKWDLGKVTGLDNNAFFNLEAKTGLALDVLHEDAIYRAGKTNFGNLNTCHNYVDRLASNHLNLKVPDEVRNFWKQSDTWSQSSKENSKTIPIKETVKWKPGTVRVGSVETPGDLCKRSMRFSKDKRGTCLGGPIDRPGVNEMALSSNADKIPQSDLQQADSSESKPVDSKIADAARNDPDTKISMVRNGGSLSSYTMFGKATMAALGAAASVAGAVFVILDFVNHNWVGGAIGLAGIGASLAAGLLVSGPAGWIVGGLIAIFFAILPGAITPEKLPADKTDIQGILQWTMFGDASHTGNEKCREGLDGAPGNPDCQVLYGTGTFAYVFGVNNFDAIAFMIQFNEGYAMTIPEMAKNFYVADSTKPGDGNDKIAVITCHNDRGVASKNGFLGGDNPKKCNHPTFKINRNLITLPNIDQTADKVFDRIIPSPNGDCKLVAFPGDQNFPQYGFKISGLPSAIACGITEAFNVDGVAVPVNPDDKRNPALGSSGDDSTDGQGGNYVAAPPAKPFKELDPKNYPCLYKGSTRFCVPPGRYHGQSGLGWELADCDSLTLPASGGWKMNAHWEVNTYRSPNPEFNVGRTDYKSFDVSYDHSLGPITAGTVVVGPNAGVTSPDDVKAFASNMKSIVSSHDSSGYFEFLAPNDGTDDVCCLFTEVNFGGNVLCMGVGGGDLPDMWKDKAKSASCHHGANMWIYADHYDDAGGAIIKGDVTDLASEPYGKDKDTFSERVKAAWVLTPL